MTTENLTADGLPAQTTVSRWLVWRSDDPNSVGGNHLLYRRIHRCSSGHDGIREPVAGSLVMETTSSLVLLSLPLMQLVFFTPSGSDS